MTCALCDLPVNDCPVREADDIFCCYGCQSVYKVLKAKGIRESFRETAIYSQAMKVGLISNPALMEEHHARNRENNRDTIKFYFEITDMWCPSCAEVIRWYCLRRKGFYDCRVDYATDLGYAEFDPLTLSKEEVFEEIRSLGYRPVPYAVEDKPRFHLNIPLAIAAFCALNIMMFAYPLYATYFHYDGEHYGELFAWASLFFSLPVVTYCAWPLYKRFISGLKIGFVGMEALVSIGVLSAFIYSCLQLAKGSTHVYFDSMAVIVAFMLFGKKVESKAKFSVKKALHRMHRALPRRGRKVLPDGSVGFVGIKEIAIGDRLIINAGEKIIVDAVVLTGSGICDESLMTGESHPVVKKTGSQLVGGTVLQQGSIEAEVIRLVEQSTLYQIIEHLHQQILHKSHYERLADKVMSWFIPSILIAAAGLALFGWVTGEEGEALVLRSLSVLLISCPCALGIAAPLAEAGLIQRLAEKGVIVRNRGCLNHLGSESLVIFDKTGTITQGSFQVLTSLADLPYEEKRWLKTLVCHSNHPISLAIALTLEDVPLFEQVVVREIPGRGIISAEYALGSLALMSAREIVVDNKDSQGMTTCVYFAKGGALLASIELGDPLRPEIQEVISILPIKKILVSGDAPSAVQSAALGAGIPLWEANCSPMEKWEKIEVWKQNGETIAMVGDGINDALALSSAHTAISVVNASEISIQVSDLMITQNSLKMLPDIFRLGKLGQKIAKQNLFWAFFYNGIGIALALTGYLTPVFSAIAMTLSSLIVIANAHRVR